MVVALTLSAAQRPPLEHVVFALAEQTVTQHELADGPADRLDRVLLDAALVIEQLDMRRVLRLHEAEAALLQSLAERPLQIDHPGNAAATTENERPRRAHEAHGTIEGDI